MFQSPLALSFTTVGVHPEDRYRCMCFTLADFLVKYIFAPYRRFHVRLARSCSLNKKYRKNKTKTKTSVTHGNWAVHVQNVDHAFFSLNSLGTVRGQRLYVKTNLSIPVVILHRFRPAVSILLVSKPLYTRMGI